jgi:reactive intermediate/imine deaminase
MKKKTVRKPSKTVSKSSAAIRRVNPPGLYPPNGYTHVVEATGGRTLYISGQVPMDPKGNVVGSGNFRAQTTQVFENLKRALAAAGAGFGDVVKSNYYVLDMSNIGILREVRAQYVGAAPPASTLVEVKRLANDAFLVEIEVVAVCAK